ncbi:hypothetical protein Q75_02890 [Bacillus coahuilensis p1.1.43]|uniref:Uncharacterized protein n=1 Tax=Bacillus coahuilensis p1.1.43 TaxID=1150625 RepID=A0A147KBH2_9BACI|nr:hypothetical protein [Bacillus coahuilensis]KUP08427.1 hypothetical protein Q75_02890 [Bacillus coahuilensis p1.1.43]
MGYYFGLTFNNDQFEDITESLQIHSQIVSKKMKMYLMASVDHLAFHLRFIDRTCIDRIIMYDFEEIGNWETLKEFSNVCKKYNINWSIIRQDIHSDVDVPLDYLTDVI